MVTRLWKLMKPSLAGLLGAPGLYEVVNYKAILELKDTDGHKAVYTKMERVRFLTDNVSTIYDYSWSDGQSFANHSVYPGRIIDRQSIGSRYKTMIALPTPKNKGDYLTLRVRRLVRDGLADKQCWLEAEVCHRTELMTLMVVLPRERSVNKAYLMAQQSQTVVPVRVTIDREGRQKLRHVVRSPKVGDRYTLQWHW